MNSSRAIVSILFRIFLCSALLTGCSQQEFFDKMLPTEEVALAKDLIAKFGAKDFAPIQAQLDPALRTPDAAEKLQQVANFLPPGTPKSIKVVGSNTFSMNDETTYNLTFEYEYPEKWLIIAIVLKRQGQNVTLEGINLTPISQSLESTNSFSLEKREPMHYVVFSLAVLIPIFVVYAFVTCVRTKIPQRKWLWLLFVALGITQFHFNWATGAWNFQPIAVTLLGAGASKMGPVAPWVFSLSVPLGAVVFLFRRRTMQVQHEA